MPVILPLSLPANPSRKSAASLNSPVLYRGGRTDRTILRPEIPQHTRAWAYNPGLCTSGAISVVRRLGVCRDDAIDESEIPHELASAQRAHCDLGSR
jgi:hypothetical protein